MAANEIDGGSENSAMMVKVLEYSPIGGCGCGTGRPCRVPAHPKVAAQFYKEYVKRARRMKISFADFQRLVGFRHALGLHNDESTANDNNGGHDDAEFEMEGLACPSGMLIKRPSQLGSGLPRPSPLQADGAAQQRIAIPKRVVKGVVPLKVLLVDFVDRPATTPLSYYENLFFSKGVLPNGSMAEFYNVASLGRTSLTGEVVGWLRMSRSYAYYHGNQQGFGNYPGNAQGLVEEAVRAALAKNVVFNSSLDIDGDGLVNGLVVIHSGDGSEAMPSVALQNANIWSHRSTVVSQISVGNGLRVYDYYTVNEKCRMGVCAHELGHLIFGWQDFYDPNGFEDGLSWDGTGVWDLMAGGSWNGDSGDIPALPAALHRIQHNWMDVQQVKSTVKGLVLKPQTSQSAPAVMVVSPNYTSGQYLLLENRSRVKGTLYDKALPGDGLLVWKVDVSKEQFSAAVPGLSLVEADGRAQLSEAQDGNDGDAGDPFPGSSKRTVLTDRGQISTSFPSSRVSSGVFFRNISQDSVTGDVVLDIEITARPVSSFLRGGSGDVVSRL